MRLEVHEVDGNVKARFACREFAAVALFDFFAEVGRGPLHVHV